MAASLLPQLQHWVIDNVQLGSKIGRRANGRILEAKWEGADVAVEEMSEEEFQAFKQSFLQECEQSSRLRHPNIVRFFGIYLPPGARVPSLVMERLHCSLTNLLEQTPVIPINTKLSILYDVSLGVRYLHSRTPPIIHCNLSSNNVLLSKGMEGKIGDLSMARLLMIRNPDTIDFMPPEALVTSQTGGFKYGKEVDVFSFGCVMLHTLSHQWPALSKPVVTDPVTLEVKGCTEVERRRSYFDTIDTSGLGVLIPLIESCLSNFPKNRTSIVTLCEQLEGLVDREHVPTVVSLQQEIESLQCCMQQDIQAKNIELQIKDAELIVKDNEIHNLVGELQRVRLALPVRCNEVNTNTADFWRNLEVTWQECMKLPQKLWVTSVAEFNKKVFVTVIGSKGGYVNPFMFDSNKNQWKMLPALPYARFSLVTLGKQLLAIGGTACIDDTVLISNKVFLWGGSIKKWLNPYPDMPTARCKSSCISYGSLVIVAGGIIDWDSWTLTRSVEVLHITDTDSQWSVVEQLPFATYEAVPLIINDNLYIAIGSNEDGDTTCNVVAASLPRLLQSSNNNASSGQVWNNLPDVPYSSFSINHYQGRLITFTGDHLVQQTGESEPVYELVPLIHMYNPDTKSWDCVGKNPHGYHFGRSVHLEENKILFIGGLTGTHDVTLDDDLVTTCMILTLLSQ